LRTGLIGFCPEARLFLRAEESGRGRCTARGSEDGFDECRNSTTESPNTSTRAAGYRHLERGTGIKAPQQTVRYDLARGFQIPVFGSHPNPNILSLRNLGSLRKFCPSSFSRWRHDDTVKWAVIITCAWHVLFGDTPHQVLSS